MKAFIANSKLNLEANWQLLHYEAEMLQGHSKVCLSLPMLLHSGPIEGTGCSSRTGL